MRCSTWGFRFLPGIAAAAALMCVVATSPAAAAGWQVVPSPNSTANDTLGAVLALSPANVWAAGTAYGSSSNSNGLIEHYDGTAWSVAPSPTPTGARYTWLTDLAGTSASDVWAVGFDLTSRLHTHPMAEHYDGASWTLTTVPQSLQLSGLSAVTALSANNVWAVGGESSSTGSTPPRAWHYDGTAWSIVSTPGIAAGNLAAVTALSATNIWAVGLQGPSGSTGQAGLAMHYDGTTWAPVSVPAPPAATGGQWALESVSATSASDVWAVGYAMPADGATQYAIVEHYDGANWSVTQVVGPSAAYPYASFAAVDALAPGDVWAVGTAAAGNGTTTAQPLVEHFDGTSWQAAPAPSLAGRQLSLTDLAPTSTTQLWAVGTRSASGSSTTQTLTARYG
jgi:hypothetical protein